MRCMRSGCYFEERLKLNFVRNLAVGEPQKLSLMSVAIILTSRSRECKFHKHIEVRPSHVLFEFSFYCNSTATLRG